MSLPHTLCFDKPVKASLQDVLAEKDAPDQPGRKQMYLRELRADCPNMYIYCATNTSIIMADLASKV